MIETSKLFVADKTAILDYFRKRAAESLSEVCATYAASQPKLRAAAINKGITITAEKLVEAAIQKSHAESWSGEEVLRAVLMLNYAYYVVMIESRNEVWPYEYMTFSRRIGELWEPFCKLCFRYPLKPIEYYVAPLFADVRRQLQMEIEEYVAQLPLTQSQKTDLLAYYHKVWSLVTSGEIKLELDLHFRIGKQNFNVDFKSGFGSNEKGNTNRLLLVATIYKNLPEPHTCVLLVRSTEDQNNNYFKTLKNSSVWEAYCGKDAYAKISDFTDFDLQKWVDENVNWKSDLNDKTLRHFTENGLERYLSW